MATASVATQELIDQRLDTIDRALMGLMPRSERLKLMADVEKMVGDSRDLTSVLAEEVAEAPRSPQSAIALRGGRGRSRLALASGVLGIVALVLLFILPVTYIIVSMIGEAIGEVAAYVLIGFNVLTVAVGGAAAIVFGIAALVRLNRRPSRQVGHGWAITGLCAGPMPMLLGGLALLLVMLPSTGLIVSERRDIPAVAYYPSDAPPANMGVPVSHNGTMPAAAWKPEPAAPSLSQPGTSWDDASAEPQQLVPASLPANSPPPDAYLAPPPSSNLTPSAELIEPSTPPTERSTPPTENAAVLPPGVDG